MATSSSAAAKPNRGNNPNTNNHSKKRKKGVDTLLTIRGRPLKAGESVRFPLVKGPSLPSGGDPVDPQSPLEAFPLIAKFGESVRRPDFTKEPWRSARLYQQEVPKPVDDSEEEEEGADGNSNAPKKKRWRYGASEAAAPRQWILQENVDFLQTMVDRKEMDTNNTANNNNPNQTLSSRYEGTAEHTPSRYGLIQLHPSTTSPQDATLQICLAPRHAHSHIQFAQPASRKTYSLTEAEHVISDQRMGLVNSRHHMMKSNQGGGGGDGPDGAGDSAATTGEGGDNATPPPPRPNILALRKKAAQSSKGRLLSKLASAKKVPGQEEEEDGDDVMGDVAFRNRRGGGGKGRKELLQTAGGDGTVTISDEGVLGGSNDAMFGGRQRFATLLNDPSAADNQEKSNKEEGGGGENEDAAGGGAGAEGGKERGADGAAMDEDFYQRDVKAEYDELDYDANEQFDDDDVDLGEGEVVETSGFGGRADDEDDHDNDEDDDDEGDTAEQGAQGLASLAGFKALLAKARGEAPAEPANDGTATQTNDVQNARKKKTVDHMAKIRMAAEQSRLAAEQKQRKQQQGHNATAAEPMDVEPAVAPEEPEAAPPAAAAASSNNNERMVDDQGLRIISLDAVRREIWLNHGSIPMKRLMKIFDVKKKSNKERQEKLLDILKELCTMKKDAVNGNMLVLKQHYSKG